MLKQTKIILLKLKKAKRIWKILMLFKPFS